MNRTIFTTATAIALLICPGVNAGPCGYGALCGRNACDSATMASYNAALPRILACQAYAKPYSDQVTLRGPITDEAQMRAWCLVGPCGDMFDELVRFVDIERNVCEIHYPSREDEVISGWSFAGDCVQSSFERFSPAFQAEMKARLAAARSGTTPSPPTTAPAPVTTAPPPTAIAPPPTTPTPTVQTPPPTTSAPTTLAPTTAAPTSEPTTTPPPTPPTLQPMNATTSTNTTTSGQNETESMNVEPRPTTLKPSTPVPSTTKPTSSALSVCTSVIGTMTAGMILVVIN